MLETRGVVTLPSRPSYTQSICRNRRKRINDFGDDPTSSSNIPNRFRLTIDGHRFLLHENEDLIIFSSDRALSILAASAHVFGDGTFSVAPSEYTQLYTLHTLVTENSAVPCFFALMKGKSKALYNQLFQQVVLAMDQAFSATSITTDFEMGALVAI